MTIPSIQFPILAEKINGLWTAARLIMSANGRISLLEVTGCASFKEAIEKMEALQ
jgi:hypothetical protein